MERSTQAEQWAAEHEAKFRQSRDRVLRLIGDMDIDDLEALDHVLDCSTDTATEAIGERLQRERPEIYEETIIEAAREEHSN